MNYQTAAIVGGVAFLLSFLAGLVGGVPLFDVVVRALFWAAVGFGLSLAVEAAMRSLLPDLFVPGDETGEPQGSDTERRVDIILDDEGQGGVFEEVEDEPEPAPRKRSFEAPVVEARSEPAPVTEAGPPGEDEEMPEIGAFLDAFKPNAPEEGEEGASTPEYAEYAPVEPSERRSSKEVTIDGEVQDPVILAKAIQTVMKRDGQGT